MDGSTLLDHMSEALFELTPADGPLCPLVLHCDRGTWHFTNDRGGAWWGLSEPDLPDWLLLPRITQMMSLPRSDTPPWFVPEKRPKSSDTDSDAPLIAAWPESLLVADRIMDLPRTIRTDQPGLCELLVDLERAADAAKMPGMPMRLRSIRSRAAWLAGDLIGVGCDAGATIKSSCVFQADLIADLAMMYAVRDTALVMEIRTMNRAPLMSADMRDLAVDLLRRAEGRCRISRRKDRADELDEVAGGISDALAMLVSAKAGKRGVDIGMFGRGRSRRLCGWLARTASDELSALISEGIAEQSPFAWLYSHPDWIPPEVNPVGMWQMGATDGSTPFLGILPKDLSEQPSAALLLMPPVHGEAASRWRTEDSNVAFDIFKMLTRKVATVPLCGYRWMCHTCKCPLSPGAAICPNCNAGLEILTHPVDNATTDARAVFAYFNTNVAAARAAVETTRWFAGYAQHFMQRCATDNPPAGAH